MQQVFQKIISDLESQFLAKEEAIRMMLVAAIAGEHMVIVGPPVLRNPPWFDLSPSRSMPIILNIF